MHTIKGDLIQLARDGEFDIIVHGCNCYNTMGSGIAPKIADAFAGPMGPREVDSFTTVGDSRKLGNISVAMWNRNEHEMLLIINGYTQIRTATKKNTCPVNYNAVGMVFAKVAEVSDTMELYIGRKPRIGYPAIGAGLAGGDWNIIYPLIQERLEFCDHTFVEFDKKG